MLFRRKFWIVVCRAHRGEPLGGLSTHVESAKGKTFATARDEARAWLAACYAGGGIEVFDIDPLAADYEGQLPVYVETLLHVDGNGPERAWPHVDLAEKLLLLDAHLRRLERQRIPPRRRVGTAGSIEHAAA
jgi:hypothetical protein